MIRLVRWMLDEYLRSQRIFVEWGAVIVVAYLAFRSHVDTASMLATWALTVVAITLYTTSVIADIVEQPAFQLRILQLQDRRTALVAALCSAVIIDFSAYVVIVAASYIAAPLAFPAFGIWVATVVPILLLITTGVIIMSMLSPLVATPLQRLIVLALITVPMAWDRVINWLPEMLPAPLYASAHAIATLFGLILWPGMQLYALCIAPAYTLQIAALLAVHCVLLGVCTLVAFRWYARKPITIA